MHNFETFQGKVNAHMKLRKYFRLARFNHWIKNVFILLGALFAQLNENGSFGANQLFILCITFLGVSFLASANYTINEFLDRGFDAEHPIKKERAAVNHILNKNVVIFQYLAFGVGGCYLLARVNFYSLILGILLLFMGFLYNVPPFRFKDKAILDVLVESVNNPIRIAIGWYCVSNSSPVPSSLIISTYGIGIYLMSLKRHAELRLLGNEAVRYRKSFANWNQEKLLVTSLVGGLIGCLFLGIYLIIWRVELLITFPAVIAIFAQYLWLSLGDPETAIAPEKLYRKRDLILLVFIFLTSLIVGCSFEIEPLRNLVIIRP